MVARPGPGGLRQAGHRFSIGQVGPGDLAALLPAFEIAVVGDAVGNGGLVRQDI